MNEKLSSQKRWRGLSIAVLAILAGMLAFVLSQGNGVQADPGFNPTADVEISDDESGANADITTEFIVPEGDVNFGQQITFTPGDPDDPTAGFFIAPGDDVDDGTVVGELSTSVVLGLLNGPCNTPLAPTFELLDASINTSDTCTFDEQFEDVGGTPRGALDYPEFLNTLFPGVTPWARMFGAANVGGIDVSINFVVFEPGDVAGFSADWGFASQTILNDPTEALAPGAITDFCTPLESANTVQGLADSIPYRANPCAPGTYTFRSYARGLPDADGDGFENDVDTCPYDPNMGEIRLPHTDGGGDGATECEGDSEATGFSDGIDCACDQDPTLPSLLDTVHCWTDSPGSRGGDCDGDQYDNRQDNCPQVPNGPDEDNQEDTDSDGIGDACDDNPNTVDGSEPEVTIETEVDITGDNLCPTDDDRDADGWTNDVEEQYGSDPDDADSTPEDAEFDEEFDQESCTDGEDNDLDGDVDGEDEGCPAEATATPTPTVAVEDADGDGFTDAEEADLGSDPDDPNSSPENVAVEGTCSDGVDNDGDGLTDEEDDGCAVTPTATPTPMVEVEVCPPVFPGTYNGSVRIDGAPAAAGLEVVATIDGVEWGSTFVSGGRYAVDVPQTLPASEPCFEGGTLVFEIDGMSCTPSVEWASGLQNLDLSCAPAAPTATPPAASPTPPAASPTPTATPSGPPPTGGGGSANPVSSLPVWAMALVGWAGLMSMAGLGVLVRR